ncbi:MAG: hypothetical protein R3E95_17940 [Thiolinea sp.]
MPVWCRIDNRHAVLKVPHPEHPVELQVSEVLQDKSRLKPTHRLHEKGVYAAVLVDPAIERLPVVFPGKPSS